MDSMECTDKPIHSTRPCSRKILPWQQPAIPISLIEAAHITANEMRASGVRWEFAPVLDCGRQPLWSRFPETYGEDVYIGKTMGATAVHAYQADGLTNPTAVAACMKHYLAYSAARTGKDRTPVLYS